MKLYLAGPMRGFQDFNFPAFHAAAAKLRAEGHEVFNPAEKGAEKDAAASQNTLEFRRVVFGLDTVWICNEAEGVVMLPRWAESRGAFAEWALANALGLPIRYLEPEYVQLSEEHGQDKRNARLGMYADPQQFYPASSGPPPKTHPFVPLRDATSAQRKMMPVASGVLDYFPDAIAAVAYISYLGNQKHNLGEPLHWARGKSDDHIDCAARHMLRRTELDQDGIMEAAEMVWRSLAWLQLEIERKFNLPPSPGSTT